VPFPSTQFITNRARFIAVAIP